MFTSKDVIEMSKTIEKAEIGRRNLENEPSPIEIPPSDFAFPPMRLLSFNDYNGHQIESVTSKSKE